MENCYKNGVIYKIFCKDSAIKDIYIGSTCDLKKRKRHHKSDCNNEKNRGYNYYVYRFIRDNGGWDNFQMIELIKYPCDTKRELELKEREYLEVLSATLNKNIPSRSQKESHKAYRFANKEHLNEKSKKHYQANKEEINEKSKKRYEANKERINEKQREKFKCDCGGKFTRCSKSRHSRSIKHQKYLNSLSI